MHKLFLAFCQKFTLKSTSRDVILPINNAVLLIVDGDRHKPVRKSRGCLFFHLLCIVFPLRSDYLRFVHPQAAFCRQSGG